MHGNRMTNEDAQMHSLIATQPRPLPDHLELSEVSTGSIVSLVLCSIEAI
jgi:hypothetical protein